MLVRVEARHFVAGLILRGDLCVEAAPILRWAIGWRRHRLRRFFEQKHWTVTIIRETGEPNDRIAGG